MTESLNCEIKSKLLNEPRVAHLATSSNNQPHVAPLWFQFVDDRIEIMTTGKKLANIRDNPHVALSLQDDTDGHPNWHIVITGNATVIEDPAMNRRQNRKLNQRYGADPDDWNENTLVRIDIESAKFKDF